MFCTTHGYVAETIHASIDESRITGAMKTQTEQGFLALLQQNSCTGGYNIKFYNKQICMQTQI